MPTPFPPSPPHSTEAERTTIGALLVDPDRIVDVAPAIQSNDFFDPTSRKVFEAIRRLYDDRKPIDFVTVADALKGDNAIEALGGSAFLAGLASNVPTSSHAAHYAAIVRDIGPDGGASDVTGTRTWHSLSIKLLIPDVE